MRSTWSGSISFGLVNIPVHLYNATEDSTIGFDYLHDKDLARIRYARVCTLEDREVPYEEIVRGFQYSKGDYVVLAEEDFQKASVNKRRAIEIEGFVDESEIETIYFEKPYYLEPQKGADKAYALLRDAMWKSKRVGIARFLLRTREHLAVIRPYGRLIVLDQIRFNEEIRRPDTLKIPNLTATARELDLAVALIDQLTIPFEPQRYADTYKHELEQIIEQKVSGQVPASIGRPVDPTKVADLMAVLKASLNREKERRQDKERNVS